MTILLDILHPAHVHFFRNAIADLREAGHDVVVTARDKDLTLDLLRRYGIPYVVLSREARSKIGLIRELLSRNRKLARIVREKRPAVMASIGGISTAQVGFLTRTRNIIFYDTENATVSNLLSYPLATEVVTPECYGRKVLGRHVTYPGYHELAYLHPKRFSPDPQVLAEHGIGPTDVYSVVRLVSWKAVHDLSARGFSPDETLQLVRRLERFGRVFITSESPLPDELERYRLPVSPDRIHHLLAFACLFIGESATMASESVILGTPAVYLDDVGRGYTKEQQERYGLCFNFRPAEAEAAIGRAEAILDADLKHDPVFESAVARMLSEKIDVTEFILARLT